MIGSRGAGKYSRRSLAACGAALLLFAIGSTRVDAESGPARLRVGIATIYPPVAFKDGDVIRGVEADFAHQLAQDFGTQVDLVETEWKELIPSLEQKKIDVIMSGMSITPERKAKVDFTQPYKKVGQMALIRKADFTKFSGPGAMKAKGVRVGVESHTTGEAYARKHLPQASITAFANPDEGIAKLRKGEIDFFIHDAPTIWRTVGRATAEDPDLTGLYTPLTDEGLAWAVRKGDTKTRKFLDAALARWEKDGTLQAIVDHWVPVKKVAVPVQQ
jgi:polar amino acid transport system substrate-binding protein